MIYVALIYPLLEMLEEWYPIDISQACVWYSNVLDVTLELDSAPSDPWTSGAMQTRLFL